MPIRISYHASHEQFAPSTLLDYVSVAERAGFDGAMSSDHFKPWSNNQGHSGYAWSWIGAALARTKFPVGMITVPGYRYHPAVVAQAAATLSEMFEGRYWLALGSGERLNEDITGLPWPGKPERNAKLEECARVIRRLLDGETVTHRGYTTTIDAKIYDLPKQRPPLFGAACSERTAEFVGGWADGLITIQNKLDSLRRIVDAYKRGGGAGKPMMLQVALNWAPTENEALAGAHEQWRYNVLGGEVNWDLRSPEDFEHATRYVRPEDMRDSVHVSADLGQHAAWLQGYVELGFDHIVLHQVDRQQERFIETFAHRVLPQLRQ